jgi:hypothetical protein
MSLKLRDVQRLLSHSKKVLGQRFSVDGGGRTLTNTANFIVGKGHFRDVQIRSGVVVNACDCRECRAAGLNADIQSRIDSWASKYGGDADLATVLAEEMRAAKPEQQPGDGEQSDQEGQDGQDGQDGQSDGESCGQAGTASRKQSDNGSAQQTGSAPDQPADQKARGTAKPALTPEQQNLQRAKKLIANALKAVREQPQNMKAKSVLAHAKELLKTARKNASFHRVAMASSPSISARKHLSSAHGRLRRVPQKLRSQMAELINRLVSQAGTAGEKLGPIPVLSARKIVNRMLVRRPLQNALKEDSVSGRPITLFLPDVSPSCAAQAQTACDLANAASYAGLTGSDVLVLPHANGMVDPSEEYIPWLNGKPVTTNVDEIPQIFDDVCNGRSRFTVRVAVFIGDHDAVHHYGSVAALKTVLRVVWLHNYRDLSSRESVTPVTAGSFLRPDWSPVADKKLSMVAGCTSMVSMLHGFKTAVK